MGKGSLQGSRLFTTPRPDYILKIGLIGASGVGKRTYLARLSPPAQAGLNRELYLRGWGTAVASVKMRIRGEDRLLKVSNMVWDVTGKLTEGSLREAYLFGIQGLIAIVDSSRPDTLDWLAQWIPEPAKRPQGFPIAIILNKADLAGPQAVAEMARLAPGRLSVKGAKVYALSAATGSRTRLEAPVRSVVRAIVRSSLARGQADRSPSA